MLLSMDEFRAFEPKKTTYALFGWPLGHTMSPELHAQLFEASGQDADYRSSSRCKAQRAV